MKRVLILALLSLVGCVKLSDPVPTNTTDNGEVKVEKLFTNDGCSVYRFRDGRYHYYTDCRGSTIIVHTEFCGKNCSKKVDDEIYTVGGRQ